MPGTGVAQVVGTLLLIALPQPHAIQPYTDPLLLIPSHLELLTSS